MSHPIYSESKPAFTDHELIAKINIMRSVMDTNQMIKERRVAIATKTTHPNFLPKRKTI